MPGVAVELTGDFGTSQPTLSAFELRGASLAYGTGDVYVYRTPCGLSRTVTRLCSALPVSANVQQGLGGLCVR